LPHIIESVPLQHIQNATVAIPRIVEKVSPFFENVDPPENAGVVGVSRT
jgi:hypothetical protein